MTFETAVMAHAFAGQHSYCSNERNPHLGLVIEEARAKGMPDEHALIHKRNCTGNPANAFNRPKVDLGPEALAFARDCDSDSDSDSGTGKGSAASVAARVLAAVLV